MGPRYDLSFCACTTTWLAPELLGSMGSSLHLYYCAFKTATLWPQLLVSMGPRPHLWFSAYKTACLASELLVSRNPDPTCGFCLQNNDFWSWITSLYGSQTWPVILCIYHSVISTRISRLCGSQPSSVVFACKTATFGPEYKSLSVPDLICRFVYAKQRDLHKNKKTIWVPALTCGFVHAKQRL